MLCYGLQWKVVEFQCLHRTGTDFPLPLATTLMKNDNDDDDEEEEDGPKELRDLMRNAELLVRVLERLALRLYLVWDRPTCSEIGARVCQGQILALAIRPNN